jgi:hypothetical protein
MVSSLDPAVEIFRYRQVLREVDAAHVRNDGRRRLYRLHGPALHSAVVTRQDALDLVWQISASLA